MAEVPSPTRSRRLTEVLSPTKPRRLEEDKYPDAERLSCREWEIDPQELEIHELVGVGATAQVHRAGWYGTDVAVKRLLPISSDQETPEWFRRELSLLLELRHPNLVLFMGAAIASTAHPLIISEFCAGGTLFRLLHERDVKVTWPQRLKMATDTAKGMNFLHCRRVIHRDLKSLNLLLASEVSEDCESPWLKISDFGLSRRLPSQPIMSTQGKVTPTGGDSLVMTGGLGTYLWMAPEILNGGTYDVMADVYSFGIVLFELVCRRLPYEGAIGACAVATAVAVANGKRPDLRHVPSDCPRVMNCVMEQCWLQRPSARPSFADVLEAFSGLNFARGNR